MRLTLPVCAALLVMLGCRSEPTYQEKSCEANSIKIEQQATARLQAESGLDPAEAAKHQEALQSALYAHLAPGCKRAEVTSPDDVPQELLTPPAPKALVIPAELQPPQGEK
jgi:hypothetical protein